MSGKKAEFSNNHSMLSPFCVFNLFPFHAGAPEVASRWSSGISFCCWRYHHSSMVPNEFVAWRSLVYHIIFQLFIVKAYCSICDCGSKGMDGYMEVCYVLTVYVPIFLSLIKHQQTAKNMSRSLKDVYSLMPCINR